MRASQVLNLDLRGVLGLLVVVKLRECLVGGSVWGEMDLKSCSFDRDVLGLEGIVFGNVFNMADMLMGIMFDSVSVITKRNKREIL